MAMLKGMTARKRMLIIQELQKNIPENIILDLIITSIRYRFNQPAFVPFLKLEQLLLKIIKESICDSELKYVLDIYKDNRSCSNSN